MRRLVHLISAVLLIAGIGCIIHARSFPVYTDPDAPGRLSGELDDAASTGVPDFSQWHKRLREFETPHKRFADLGRGLCAAGIGLFLAGAFGSSYLRPGGVWSVSSLLSLWSYLWLGRIPFSIWYYSVRQARFEYPSWGDSIMIPIVSEAFSCVIAAVVSSGVLGLLWRGYSPSSSLLPRRPVTLLGWLRAALIGCWLLLLAACVATGVPDGHEGQVISCILAVVILLACLSSVRQSNPAKHKVRPSP